MNQETKKTCNGWSNFQTWVVNLWISNEQGSYLHWRNRTKALLAESATEDERLSALARLADEIRDAIHEECAITKPNLAADLMNAALAEVEWHEIAQDLLDSSE
jgi:hypothetical protein